jgi:hypothetical protein
MSMLVDVFDEQELKDMAATMAGASLAELEHMKSMLREVKQMIYREISSRSGIVEKAVTEVKVIQTAAPKARKGYVRRTCDNRGCGIVYEARQADLKRGWGKCCSKSCAASHKLRCNPSHGYLHGGADRERMSEDEIRERDHQAALSDCEMGWDAHKGSF